MLDRAKHSLLLQLSKLGVILMSINSMPALGENKIQIQFDNQTLTATIFDNDTAQDFLALLPLTINMTDIPGQEYAGRLPHPVSTGGHSKTSHVSGDIAYWEPGNSLVFFYESNPNFGYTIHPIGQFDSDPTVFKSLMGQPITVTINKN